MHPDSNQFHTFVSHQLIHSKEGTTSIPNLINGISKEHVSRMYHISQKSKGLVVKQFQHVKQSRLSRGEFVGERYVWERYNLKNLPNTTA